MNGYDNKKSSPCLERMRKLQTVLKKYNNGFKKTALDGSLKKDK